MLMVSGFVLREQHWGADDGIGVAYELAILDADDIEHGPIECLFTRDEETGLTGAFGLEEGFMTGNYLINLDSEDEGQILLVVLVETVLQQLSILHVRVLLRVTSLWRLA